MKYKWNVLKPLIPCGLLQLVLMLESSDLVYIPSCLRPELVGKQYSTLPWIQLSVDSVRLQM